MQLLQFCDKIVMVMSMISPFQGFTELQKRKLLLKLETHTYKFNKNEEILSNSLSKNIICIILDGSAKIVNINYLGEEILIEDLEKDSVFGTDISAINDTEIQIIANETTTVLIIDYNRLINSNNLQYTYYNLFVFNILQILNDKLRDTNNRIQILTKKNIRDKLLAFFENEYRKTRSQKIYLDTSLKDIADYICVNRSAMFRELRNLKDEGFIKVEGRKITLLYIPSIKK